METKGFNHTILEEIKGFNDTIHDEIKEDTDQNNLVCIIGKNDTIIYFIIEIFYKLLELNYDIISKEEEKSAVDTKFKKEMNNYIKETIECEQEEGVVKEEIITKIGFKDKDIDPILDTFIELKKKDAKMPKIKHTFSTLKLSGVPLKDKLHLLSTTFSSLNKSELLAKYILNDDTLKEKFIEELCKMFNLSKDVPVKVKVKGVSKEEKPEETFDRIYKEAWKTEKKKKNYDYFIIKLSHQASIEGKNGIFQKNLGREKFSRNYCNFKDKKPPNVGFSNLPCWQDLQTSDNTKLQDITAQINLDNTVTKDILEAYGRNPLGGVSGSVYYLFFCVFKILHFELNLENLTKVLLIAILDYVPIWHSLEEILVTISIEFEFFKIERYNISEDPVEYLKTKILATFDSKVETENEKKAVAAAVEPAAEGRHRKKRSSKRRKNKRKGTKNLPPGLPKKQNSVKKRKSKLKKNNKAKKNKYYI